MANGVYKCQSDGIVPKSCSRHADSQSTARAGKIGQSRTSEKGPTRTVEIRYQFCNLFSISNRFAIIIRGESPDGEDLNVDKNDPHTNPFKPISEIKVNE